MKPRDFGFKVPLVVAVLGLTALANADTSVIRELAKNDTDVAIVISGDHARLYADRLARTIRTHKEYNDNRKKKKVQVLTVAEAEAIAPGGGFDKISRISILDDSEGTASNALSSALDVPITPARDFMTFARIKTYGAKAGKQIFSVVLRAPDDERLSKVFGDFEDSKGKDYSHLDYEQSFRSNKVILHHNSTLDSQWGSVSGAWNYIRTAKTSELAPEGQPTAEEDLAYFIDRSRPCETLPPMVQEAFMKLELKPTSATAAVVDLPTGRKMALFTAPNATHLRALATKFSDVDDIPRGGYRVELPDLRYLSTDPSVVAVNLNLAGEDRQVVLDALNEYMGKSLRDQRIKVLDNGPALKAILDNITLDKLMGATGDRLKLRRTGTRYVWYLTVTHVTRGTNYKPETSRLTPSRPKPTYPTRPVKQIWESAEAFQSRVEEWQTGLSAYQDDLNTWNDREPVEYRQTVSKSQTATLEMQLKLFDLTLQAGEVSWETQVTGRGSASTDVQTKSVVVNGNLRRPGDLTAPGREDKCEVSIVLNSGRDAAEQSIRSLALQGWVEGDPVVKFWDASLEKSLSAAPAIPMTATGKVVTVTTSGVVVDIGAENAAVVGDLIVVTVGSKSFQFKVAVAGPTLRCTPLNAAAKKALSTIRKGSSAVWKAQNLKK